MALAVVEGPLSDLLCVPRGPYDRVDGVVLQEDREAVELDHPAVTEAAEFQVQLITGHGRLYLHGRLVDHWYDSNVHGRAPTASPSRRRP